MSEVIHHINAKMIRRHPHVFGNISVAGSDEVKVNWAAIKAQEKAAKGEPEPAFRSILAGVQPALPALAQALDISQKAVKVGFEWDDTAGVLQKLVEEAHEIATAITSAEVESEIGDFLFTAVNLARKLGVDPEIALRTTNTRFTRRFQHVEAQAQAHNLTLSELDIETWRKFWQIAKEALAKK